MEAFNRLSERLYIEYDYTNPRDVERANQVWRGKHYHMIRDGAKLLRWPKVSKRTGLTIVEKELDNEISSE